MKTSTTLRRKKTLRSKLLRRGSILVLSAVMLVAIFAFTSFTVDVGLITVTKAQLETAADAGSLAASLELSQGLGPAPEKTTNEVDLLARQAAVDVAALHRSGNLSSAYVNSARDVRFGQVYWDTNTNAWVKAWGVAPYNMVEVSLLRFEAGGSGDGPLPLFFGPIIGHDTANVSASTISAIIPGSGFRVEPGSGRTVGVLPITLDAAKKSSTYGSTVRMPRASGVKPGRDANGLSQTTRWTDRANLAICSSRRSGSPVSHPSDIISAIAPPRASRRLQSRLNRSIASPIRVPPDQSSTDALTRANA